MRSIPRITAEQFEEISIAVGQYVETGEVPGWVSDFTAGFLRSDGGLLSLLAAWALERNIVDQIQLFVKCAVESY